MGTLEKLLHTRSTKIPHLTILHFVLALMDADDVQDLFSDGDIVLLRNASLLGTYKVAHDCKELVSGLYDVKQMCEKGKYAAPVSARVVMIENRDDRFYETMQAFVDSHVDQVDEIALENQQMLLLYKQL